MTMTEREPDQRVDQPGVQRHRPWPRMLVVVGQIGLSGLSGSERVIRTLHGTAFPQAAGGVKLASFHDAGRSREGRPSRSKRMRATRARKIELVQPKPRWGG